ncbi:hypothetical protein AAVH_11902 [Aphelenchoides avenae]|nr:hypothetical protein AAVH_11902 [Aphelenchus avenae]
MRLVNESLLDVCAYLTRFHLDIVEISSRRFRHPVDANTTLLPVRAFSHVTYYPLRVYYYLHGRASHVEEDMTRAFERLACAYVDRFYVVDMSRTDFFATLAARQHTFGVGAFEFL